MLIMSDGSSTIYFLSETFELIKKISVKDGLKPISSINEMEFIKGEVIFYRSGMTTGFLL